MNNGRLGRLHNCAVEHLRELFTRYPRIHTLGETGLEEILDRDFTNFKKQLTREKITASREEISHAFEHLLVLTPDVIGKLRLSPTTRAKIYLSMHRAVHRDVGLAEHLTPVEKVVSSATALEEAACHAITRAKRQRATSELVKVSPDIAVDVLTTAGVSGVVSAIEQHPIALPELPEITVRALGLAITEAVKGASPLIAARSSDVETRTRWLLNVAMRERLAAHAAKVRAEEAKRVSPTLVNSLIANGVDQTQASKLAEVLAQVRQIRESEDATRHASQITRHLNTIATTWAVSEVAPAVFEQQMHRVLSIVLHHTSHSHIINSLTALQTRLQEGLDKTIAKRSGVDIVQLKQRHPNLARNEAYRNALAKALAQHL